MEVRKIVKNGNCLGVNISRDYLRYLNLARGDEVIMTLGKNYMHVIKRGKSDGKNVAKEGVKNG